MPEGRAVFATEQPICAWCLDAEGTTSDEIFPRFVGGTREFALPSCPKCQAIISKAERHVAERTDIGIIRALTPGARPRHPRKASSGAVLSPVFLPGKSTPGLQELRLRVGDANPQLVSTVEFDIPNNKLHYRHRAGYPALRERANRFQGVAWSIRVEFVDPPPMKDDASYFPRLLLDRAGKLRLRVRNRGEHELVVDFLEDNLPLPSEEAIAWAEERYDGPQEATAVIGYEFGELQRVVLKVAFGVLAHAVPSAAFTEEFHAVRATVLDRRPADFWPVRTLVELRHEPREGWPTDHFAILQAREGNLVGVVVLYTAAYWVDLGPAPDQVERLAVIRCTPPRGPVRPVLGEDRFETAQRVVDAVERLAGRD